MGIKRLFGFTRYRMPKFGELPWQICCALSLPDDRFRALTREKLVINSLLLSRLLAERVRLVKSRLSASQTLQFADQ